MLWVRGLGSAAALSTLVLPLPLFRLVAMQTILPSEFKRQMVVMLDGSPHVIEDMHTSGTAQTRHKLHTRLRHLTTGRVTDRVFAESERVPVAPLETRRATYGYAQGDTRIFTDIETFDEFEFSNEQLGDRRWFLKENEEYKALRLDGKLLNIVLPPQISLKVMDTAPPSRTDLNSSWKEAKLRNGPKQAAAARRHTAEPPKRKPEEPRANRERRPARGRPARRTNTATNQHRRAHRPELVVEGGKARNRPPNHGSAVYRQW